MTKTGQDKKITDQDVQNRKEECKQAFIDKESRLQEIAHKAGKDLNAFIATKQEYLNQAKNNCEQLVKKHPVASTGVAFACGLLLGFLLKRK